VGIPTEANPEAPHNLRNSNNLSALR